MVSSQSQMLPISFPYDDVRASHAARWLLSRHGGKLDRIKLIKLVFLADRLHLARYGRPIVGGQYVSTTHGQASFELCSAIDAGTLESVAEAAPLQLEATAEADGDYLAESDVEVLRETSDRYGAWDDAVPLPYERVELDVLHLILDDQEAEAALG